jgi:hypothetical protein
MRQFEVRRLTGVGAELVRDVIAWANERGRAVVRLWVVEASVSAVVYRLPARAGRRQPRRSACATEAYLVAG